MQHRAGAGSVPSNSNLFKEQSTSNKITFWWCFYIRIRGASLLVGYLGRRRRHLGYSLTGGGCGNYAIFRKGKAGTSKKLRRRTRGRGGSTQNWRTLHRPQAVGLCERLLNDLGWRQCFHGTAQFGRAQGGGVSEGFGEFGQHALRARGL